MFIFSGNYSKHKAWELSFFHKYRSLEDGLTVCNILIEHDWYKGDHKPSFSFNLILFNIMVIEFNLYDTRHVEDFEDCETAPPKEVKMPCPNCKTEVTFRMNNHEEKL
jgi:hypothetical protein